MLRDIIVMGIWTDGKKKGEVWPQKLADVNIQTKHMAALAGTKRLADSLFPPTSFSCLM